MAVDTPLSYRNLVIYQVYLRNYGVNGTFADLEADLPRIRSMGIDIIYLLPIHPIGKLNKKGSLGCPYSISDYRDINPEYGTKADFARLIHQAHNLNMKVMIDVVFNHTSHDSVLVREHPEWFHQDANGEPITTVPEWTDVIDLKYPNKDLTIYLINILKEWVRFGVDGFRCDVASLLPLEFWLQARQSVAQIKPQMIWLAESVHASFIKIRRSQGLTALSDSEIFSAFDIAYDYDIWSYWQNAVRENVPVDRYLEMLCFQGCIYPQNYVKLRGVENHDQPRIMHLCKTREQALAWTAFMAFNQGTFFIYAGQESEATITPSLFEVDKIKWGQYELQDFITRLSSLKKDDAQVNGQLYILSSTPAIQAAWIAPEGCLYGVFNVNSQSGTLVTQLPDGIYTNIINDKDFTVKNKKMRLPDDAAIFHYRSLEMPKEKKFELLDFGSEE